MNLLILIIDFVALQTGAKRGRKPGKTGPRNASTARNESAPSRTAAAGGRKNTNNSGIVPVPEADGGSLFEIVKQGRIALTVSYYSVFYW